MIDLVDLAASVKACQKLKNDKVKTSFIVMVRSLKKDHGYRLGDIAKISGYSQQYLSDVLSYRREIPPDMFVKLVEAFVGQK